MAATRWEACLRTSGPQISAVRHDRSLQLPRGAFILKIGLPHAARRDDCADRRVVGEMMALQPGLDRSCSPRARSARSICSLASCRLACWYGELASNVAPMMAEHRLLRWQHGRSLPKELTMSRRFVDLSIYLENDVLPTRRPSQPKIEYFTHENTYEQIAPFFPGLKKEDLPDGEGWAVETGAAVDAQRHASRCALPLPLDDGQGAGRARSRRSRSTRCRSNGASSPA